MERSLHRLGLSRAAERKWLALAVVDVTDPRSPRVAAVNGDDMLYAASLPKIAILLGAFVLIEEGDMTLDDATREAALAVVLEARRGIALLDVGHLHAIVGPAAERRRLRLRQRRVHVVHPLAAPASG